jgi:hypothetical protein
MANGLSTRLREEPFDWVVRSLANVLGVAQGSVPLRRDQPLSLASDADIASLAGQLAKRFVRVEDPLTGQVSYSVNGPAIAIDVGEVQVEELAHRATLVFPGVRAKLAEIDPNVCRPGVCADDVRSLVDSSRAAIDQLDAELRGHAAKPVVDTLFDELLADDRGWLALLAEKLDQGAGDLTYSVAHERQRKFLAIVSEGLVGLQEAWEQYRGGEGDLGAQLAQVERCAGHITEQSVAIRVLLSEYGIGRCELEAVIIELGEVWIGGEAHGQCYRSLSLADLLRHCERFGQRLPGLARLGRRYQLDTIRRTARTLDQLVEKFEPRAAVQGQLHLIGDDAEAAVASIERLRGLVSGFVRLLGYRRGRSEDDGGDNGGPKGRSGGGSRRGPHGGRRGGEDSAGGAGPKGRSGGSSGSSESAAAKSRATEAVAPDADRAPLSS